MERNGMEWKKDKIIDIKVWNKLERRGIYV